MIQDELTPEAKRACDIYDMLMMEIEPDLVTSNIPLLQAQYQDETLSEYEARMERYAAAYRVYDIESQKFTDTVGAVARHAKRTSLKEKEDVSKGDEAAALAVLTSAFK